MPKKFTGSREQYLAAFRKQLSFLIWCGLVFGVVDIGFIFIETEPGEWIVKLVGAALWLVVFAISFVSRRMLADASPAATAAGSGV